MMDKLRRYPIRVLGGLAAVTGLVLWIAGIGPGKTITVIGAFVVLLFGDSVRSLYLGQAIAQYRYASKSFRSGKHEDAADEAAQAAVNLRKLGFARPAELKRLAPALSLQWAALENLDRHADAALVAEELVAVYRTVGENYWERFYLADSMERLETSVSELPADRVGAEADELLMARAELAYEANRKHARALGLVADRHVKLREYDAALPLLIQAADILRPLAAEHPDRRSSLVGALTDLGHCLSDLDEHERAQAAYAEALDVSRTLDETTPTAQIRHLVNLAGSLRELQRYEEAVPNDEAAVAILRANLRNGDDNEKLVLALGLLGDDLRAAHRLEDALAAYQEALTVRRTTPALQTVIQTLRALGRPDEARPLEDELQTRPKPGLYTLTIPQAR
ncbi:tetratricopeptide repeat protein [Kribbella sp. NBC_00889]|uniref:tetratricopeptide repeat protein n=1 Tax=Kribbella sp. NBC_00889 TaxID=2975974 RepID=UPI0038643808|nr:tetratricopeptide repeat protein [Kribbella sp. NBC_00889]